MALTSKPYNGHRQKRVCALKTNPVRLILISAVMEWVTQFDPSGTGTGQNVHILIPRAEIRFPWHNNRCHLKCKFLSLPVPLSSRPLEDRS